MLAHFSSTRLIFVTGKGGVGKSTATAALGMALAKAGKRTLLIETDTYSAMADLFRIKLDHGQVTKHSDNLWLQNLLAEDALIHIIKKFVPSERLSRSVIQNRVARVFFKAAPSVNEFSILNRVYDYHQETEGARPRFDHIIVDLPASGHAVTFLNVPNTLHGMMRGIGGFAALTKEIGEMIANPKKCAIVAVCLPEEMPVRETIELAQSFKETINRDLNMTMLNMVHHAPFDMTHKAPFESLQQNMTDDTGEAIERIVQANDLALQWFERDNIYIEMLQNELESPIVELPMFYAPNGQDVVEQLADHLRDATT